MTYISDADVRKEYGLPDNLVGKELDAAAEKVQAQRNAENKK